jgi:hypothetical protein
MVAEPAPEIVVFIGVRQLMAALVADGEVLAARPLGSGLEQHALFSE